jgi:hypothetical protein
MLEDRFEKCGLGGEVVVKRSGRYSSGACRILHGGLPKSFLAEQFPACADQRIAGLPDVLGAQRRRLRCPLGHASHFRATDRFSLLT